MCVREHCSPQLMCIFVRPTARALMSIKFRVLSWNCRRARATSPIWGHLMEINPDLALLQEVSSIPESIERAFATSLEHAAGKAENPQRFKTGILVRGSIEDRLVLSSPQGLGCQ